MTKDLEQALLEIIREEIDREVMVELSVASFLDMGWTLVAIGDDADLTGMDAWMRDNIRGEWRLYAGKAVLSDANEAVLFRMAWS